jgi:hypothetical protein
LRQERRYGDGGAGGSGLPPSSAGGYPPFRPPAERGIDAHGGDDGDGEQGLPAAEGQDREHRHDGDGGGHAGRPGQDAGRRHGAAEVHAQEHCGRHADQGNDVGQPQRGQAEQHQADCGDDAEQGVSRQPGRMARPVRPNLTGYGGQLAQHLARPRDVGVDRADREDQRGRGAHRPPGRADGQLKQVGERNGQVRAAA